MEPIDFRRSVEERRTRGCRSEPLERQPVRRGEIRVARPQFLDRKIRFEQATRRAEHPHRFPNDGRDAVDIIAMDEGPEPQEFANYGRARGETAHFFAPSRPSGRRKVFQHASMLEHERHSGTIDCEFTAPPIWSAKTCNSKSPAIGEAGDVA